MERPEELREAVTVTSFRNTGWARLAVAGLAMLLAASVFGGGAAEAYGGGRFGGRSGFSRRSFPAAPSLPGRYSPYLGRGFSGRGFGSPGFYPFPLFLPFGGGAVGSGGLGTLLVLGLGGFILFVMINDIMVRVRGGQGWRGYGSRQRGTGTQSVAILQLGLLATGRSRIEAIREVARNARTGTPEGLANALAETAVLLGRQPEVWSAARWVVDRTDDPETAEARLGEWTARERVKMSREAFANVEGQVREARPAPKDSWAAGVGFVITIIVAVGRPVFDTIERPAQEDVSRILQKLAGLPPSSLLGLEVLWVPEPPTEPLAEEELLMQYPELQPL